MVADHALSVERSVVSSSVARDLASALRVRLDSLNKASQLVVYDADASILMAARVCGNPSPYGLNGSVSSWDFETEASLMVAGRTGRSGIAQLAYMRGRKLTEANYGGFETDNPAAIAIIERQPSRDVRTGWLMIAGLAPLESIAVALPVISQVSAGRWQSDIPDDILDHLPILSTRQVSRASIGELSSAMVDDLVNEVVGQTGNLNGATAVALVSSPANQFSYPVSGFLVGYQTFGRDVPQSRSRPIALAKIKAAKETGQASGHELKREISSLKGAVPFKVENLGVLVVAVTGAVNDQDDEDLARQAGIKLNLRELK